MDGRQFAGDKKLPMKSLLARPERAFIDACVPHFPRSIEGYHLTLCTILWSAGVILFGYLARHHSIHWLWGTSAMLFMQWFTDSFDGSLGRYRDTGIPKWGYYMDHFLDYVFMCALAIGYMFLVDGSARSIVLILVSIYGAFMTSSYLAFAATNEFKITYLGCGPTELRLLFIALNTALILSAPRGVELLGSVAPYFLGASFLVLCFVVFRTQKYIWRIDMAEKARRQKAP
jgi:phosphatidylglycerophosphate synthase